MAHPRKIIRAAVKARLLNTTVAEDRVFATMTPIANIETVLSDEGPLIMVYVRGESKVEYPNQGEGGCWRTLELAIEGLSVGAEVDDLLDGMAEQIEARMDSFVVTDFPSGDFKLTETQIDVTDAFERVLGGIFLTYEFRYWSAYRPDDGSNDFLPTDDPTADGEPSGGSGGLDTIPGGPVVPVDTDPSNAADPGVYVHGSEVV